MCFWVIIIERLFESIKLTVFDNLLNFIAGFLMVGGLNFLISI